MKGGNEAPSQQDGLISSLQTSWVNSYDKNFVENLQEDIALMIRKPSQFLFL